MGKDIIVPRSVFRAYFGKCFDEILLGPDEYFVLADNRVEGTDSRIWGSVPQENIQGKAVLQYFPFRRIHKF